MVKKPPFLIGLAMGFCLSMGCGALSPYRFYGLKDADYSKGTLIGPGRNDDMPFVNCAPSHGHRFPCVIVPVSDFYKLKQDYESTKASLVSCQRGRK